MKKFVFVLLVLAGAIMLTGCEEKEVVRYVEIDNPPAVPQGVYSITADEAVYIYWLPVQDDDLDYYRIFWSDEADGIYEFIGTSEDESYVDYDVENGSAGWTRTCITGSSARRSGGPRRTSSISAAGCTVTVIRTGAGRALSPPRPGTVTS